MPTDRKGQSDRPKANPQPSDSSSRPKLGSGMAEKAAKTLEKRKSTLDKQLKDYGA